MLNKAINLHIIAVKIGTSNKVAMFYTCKKIYN